MIAQPDTELKHRVEMKSLGATIKLLREAQGMSASELADKLDVNKSYVSLLESDARKPSVDVLQKLAKTLRVPMNFLVEVATGTSEPSAHRELRGVLDEFDALERKLNLVIKKLPRRSTTP